MAHEIEIQRENTIQQAKQRKSYAELAAENQRLIEENTRLTKQSQKDIAEMKKLVKQLVKDK